MSLQAFSYVICKSTGEPIEEILSARARSLVRQLNLPMSVTVDINMESSNYSLFALENRPRLKVWRPASAAELVIAPTVYRYLCFYGELPPLGIRESVAKRTGTYTFQAPTWKLNRRFTQTAQSFTFVGAGFILWSLINQSQSALNGGLLNIAQGSTSGGSSVDRDYALGVNIGTAIDEMTKTDGGCDVDFIPIDYWANTGAATMGTWNAYTTKGSLRPDAQFMYSSSLTDGTVGGLQNNVEDIQRSRADAITQAISVGANGRIQRWSAPFSPFGVLDDWQTYPDIDTDAALLGKSVGLITARQSAPAILEVINPTSQAPQPFVDYDVGDTVYVSCRAGGMTFSATPCRVHGIDMKIDQEGKLDTRLTFVPPV